MQKDGMSIAACSGSMGSLEAFVADSNEVLKFRLVRQVSDLEPAFQEQFEPFMTHQIFGDKENIFGYRELQVQLFMTASTLKAFVKMTCLETIDCAKSGGVEPDPVIAPLLKILAPDQAIADNLDEFVKHLNSEEEVQFQPHGEKLASFECTAKGKPRHFEVFVVDESVPGFKAYHSRLQPWIMFYIDAASYIDIDDANWKFFTLFERYSDADGRIRFAVAGYVSVYQYYVYPSHMRPRISQMLILPPFQRQGLGAKLLNHAFQYYWHHSKVVDISVEAPSDDFIRLRDYLDVRNCLEHVSVLKSPAVTKSPFTQDIATAARDKLKISKRQARRVYEIIQLYWIKKNNPVLSPMSKEYNEYKANVKRRLNIPFEKEGRQIEKLRKVLRPEEFVAATINFSNPEQRQSSLENQFRELEAHYLLVLERIDMD